MPRPLTKAWLSGLLLSAQHPYRLLDRKTPRGDNFLLYLFSCYDQVRHWLIRKKEPVPDLVIKGEKIERVTSSKLLGLIISSNLSWEEHVNAITSRASQHLYFLHLLKRVWVSMDNLIRVYCSLIRPTVEYACQVWHGDLTKDKTKSIESIQKRALDIIMPDTEYDLALQISELPTLADRRVDLCKKMFTEIQNADYKLHHLLPDLKANVLGLRSKAKYPLPKCNTEQSKDCFINWCLFNLQ